MCARMAAVGQSSRLTGTTLLPCLWPKDAEGSGGGNFPPLGGSQHRICLDAGFRRRPAKRKSRAEARTHFSTEELRNDEQRDHIQHPDRVQ